MLKNVCPACGILLRRSSGWNAVCPNCLRSFRMNDRTVGYRAPEPISGSLPNKPSKAGNYVPRMIIWIALIVAALVIGFFPLAMIGFIAVLINASRIDKENAKYSGKQTVSYVACGEKLATHYDYYTQFRMLNLDAMPLGRFGIEAAEQIRRLESKMDALRALLPADHPFFRNAADAEKYILENCKQILYRLRYCDQNDRALCRVHANYLEARLSGNEKVLRDFENLIIEITQMSDALPQQQPCLDVIADTLHQIRTGEETADVHRQQMRMQ
ncbi:MAG: hypothetical protein MJ065_02995 [Oscillospiraceae bacterium]|nr:hypothetical protein [Oscillospiraceae bacterium]